MRIARIATTVATIAVLSVPAAAQAQTSSQRGYDETLGVIGQVDTPTTPPAHQTAPSQSDTAPAADVTPAQPVANEAGNLPFTGLDVGIVVLMGAVLLGTGLVLRRTARRGGAL